MKLLSVLFIMLSFAFIGIDYVAPSDKPFDDSGYFQEEKGSVDYAELYSETKGLEATSDEEKCDRSPKSITSGKHKVLYSDSKGYLPFVVDTDTNISSYLKEDKVTIANKKYQVLVLDKGSEIIVPTSAKVVNSSVKNKSLYPDEDYSLGTTIKLEDDQGYIFTFGSMERLWCCIGKTKPFGTAAEPYYVHSSKFTGATKLEAGTVLGIAGSTGVPKNDGVRQTVLLINITNPNGLTIDLDSYYSIRD